MTSLELCANFLQVDREKEVLFWRVELQSKRDEAENRTILGRNDLLPSNNNNLHTHTHSTQQQQSPNLLFLVGGFVCRVFFFNKRRSWCHKDNKNTRTHTEHVGNGRPTWVGNPFFTRGTIINSNSFLIKLIIQLDNFLPMLNKVNLKFIKIYFCQLK
jgi:hypothetical protein